MPSSAHLVYFHAASGIIWSNNRLASPGVGALCTRNPGSAIILQSMRSHFFVMNYAMRHTVLTAAVDITFLDSKFTVSHGHDFGDGRQVDVRHSETPTEPVEN